MTISERLKFLRKQRKITQEELAKSINVERSSVGKYETGTTPSMEILVRISNYFGVSVDFLLGKTQEPNLNEHYNERDIFSIPGIETIKKKKLPILGSVACGEPIFADEEYQGYISCNDDINADFCLLAKGDSMINAGIKDGSIVFVKKQPTVDSGQIAVVLIDDEATLKRVFFDNENKRLILNPENSAFAPIIIENEQLQSGQVRILGKAVACQFKVR